MMEKNKTKLTTVEQNGNTYEVALSPEHANQVNYGGVYKADPEDFRYSHPSISRYWDTSGKYHCRNWCFNVCITRDGQVRFVDNYWSSISDTYFKLTDENFDETFPKFQLIMDDPKNYMTTSTPEEYEPEDVVYMAKGNGGISSERPYVRKDAEPSPRRQMVSLVREVRKETSDILNTHSLEWSLAQLEKKMNEIDALALPYGDEAEMAKRDAYVESLDCKPITLGDMADGNFEGYLDSHHGEVSVFRSWGYYTHHSTESGILLGEHPTRENNGNENTYGYFYNPNEKCVIVVAYDEEKKVSSCAHVDGTLNNIRMGVEGYDESPEFDEYDYCHVNNKAADVAKKARKVIDAIEELKEAWKQQP